MESWLDGSSDRQEDRLHEGSGVHVEEAKAAEGKRSDGVGGLVRLPEEYLADDRGDVGPE